jgi:hypothetical protein
MQLLLNVSGAIALLVLALIVVVSVLKAVLARSPELTRRIRLTANSRSIFPYTNVARARLSGWFLTIFGRAWGVAPAYTAALRATSVDNLKHLRDAMVELDTLPTVRAGSAAIGIKSVFELASTEYWKVPSPYTSHLQYPPFFIPGVPARPFYDPSEFVFTKILEDNYQTIKTELVNLLSQNAAGFKGYVSEGASRVAGWNTFNFFFMGKKFEENCALCPKTTAILESLPRFEKDHIMFSALNPHARIKAHTGPMNGILRAHLGLVVPGGAYIRVGKEEQAWSEGKVMVFDDSFEHEVWNHSDQVRIVLFLNFWHPCLSERDIKAIERYRTAYEQNPVAQLHADIQATKGAHDLETARVNTGVQPA